MVARHCMLTGVMSDIVINMRMIHSLLEYKIMGGWLH